jgi:gentisate 1,2-dioxygenase
VFDGAGTVVLDGERRDLVKGDLFVLPSWTAWSLEAESKFDLFGFSGAPIVERLHFQRAYLPESGRLVPGSRG